MRLGKIKSILHPVLAGVLLWAAFPPLGQPWLAWIALTVLLRDLDDRSGRAGLGRGFVFGLTFFGLQLTWLIRFGVVAWLPLVVLEAAFVAVFGGVAARASRRPRRFRVAVLPLAWAGIELLRASVPFGGFAWGALGASQVDLAVARLGRVGGVHLLSAALVLFGVLTADLVRTARTTGTGQRRATLALAAAAAGVVVLPAVLPVGLAGRPGTTIDVAAVQGNVPRDRFTTLGSRGGRTGPEDLVVIDNHLDVTARLLTEEVKPQLIVWPENAFDRDPMRIPAKFAETTGLVRDLGSHLLAGAILDDGAHFTNSNLLLDPSGSVVGRYDKVHLVPFGEYVPIPATRRFIPILDQEIPIDGRAGTKPVVLAVGGVGVGSVICFESTDAPLVRRFVEAGAGLLVVTTNDASFGESATARQHLQHSRMRAIETGRAVVHAAIAGESAMILPDGRVVDRAGLFVPALLRARLPVASVQTPFTRYGEEMGWLYRLAAAVALGAALRRRRLEGSRSEPA